MREGERERKRERDICRVCITCEALQTTVGRSVMCMHISCVDLCVHVFMNPMQR